MKIALIVLVVIAVASIAFEICLKIAARRAEERFDAMSPDEQRKEQERLYKAQQMGS